jgi:hypothetical protein
MRIKGPMWADHRTAEDALNPRRFMTYSSTSLRTGSISMGRAFRELDSSPSCALTKFVDRPRSSRNIERRTAE